MLKLAINKIFSNGLMKSKLFKGGVGSVGVVAANKIITLILGVFLARVLGPDGFGVYAYVFAIMGLLMVLAEAGTPTLVLREVSSSLACKDWKRMCRAYQCAYSSVFLISIIISFIGMMYLFLVRENLEEEFFFTAWLMLFTLPLVALSKVVWHAHMGLHKVVSALTLNMLVRPLVVLVLVFALFVFFCPDLCGPQYVMGGQLVSAMIVLVVGIYILNKDLPKEYFRNKKKYRCMGLLKDAFPFVLIGSAGVINSHADIIILGWFYDSEDVGIYRVVVQGAALVTLGLHAVSSVVNPRISEMYSVGEIDRLKKFVQAISMVVFFITFPFVLVLIGFGDYLLLWVFGAEYVSGYAPLVILSMGHVALALFGVSVSLSTMAGYEKYVSRSMLWSSLANVVLNILMVPSMGMIGAALSTFITTFLWYIFLFFLVKRALGINVMPFCGFMNRNRC